MGGKGQWDTAKDSIIIQFLKATTRNPWDIGEWFRIKASSFFPRSKHFCVLNITSQTLAVAVKREQQPKIMGKNSNFILSCSPAIISSRTDFLT